MEVPDGWEPGCQKGSQGLISSADLLEMRVRVLMTLLAGVVRCWHQSDWFRMLTSRQRNAAGTTHCDYHLNEAAHEAPHLWVFPLCLCYTTHNTLITGHFEPPQGWGCNPSVLLPAGTAVRGDGTEATGELLSLQAHHLFERCHIHVPQCMMRVQQALCSVFFSLIWGSKLLEKEDLPCGVTRANTQYETDAGTCIFFSSFFILFFSNRISSFCFCLRFFCWE